MLPSEEGPEAPKPTPEVARRIEELLHEQLEERGVNPHELSPEIITRDMECAIEPDSSMTYYWQGEAILFVTPEIRPNSVMWRMFTRDDMPDYADPAEPDHA